MEHVMRPLVAYENIHKSMELGGILYGNFEDHEKDMFHISPDLMDLRKKITQNFKEIHYCCYKKIS